MLHDGQLVEHFREVHFDHARVDFVPCFDLWCAEVYGLVEWMKWEEGLQLRCRPAWVSAIVVKQF